MKSLLYLISIAKALPDGFQESVWPKPQAQFNYNIELHLTKEFTFVTDSLPKDDNCLTVRYAADRYWEYIFKGKEDVDESLSRQGRSFVPKRFSDYSTNSTKKLTHMTLVLNGASCEEYPGPDSTEEYSLSINDEGAQLTSGSVWGILRGLETFYQLLYGNAKDEVFVKEIDVIDYPRFKH